MRSCVLVRVLGVCMYVSAVACACVYVVIPSVHDSKGSRRVGNSPVQIFPKMFFEVQLYFHQLELTPVPLNTSR